MYHHKSCLKNTIKPEISPYLLGTPVSKAPKDICYYCGNEFFSYRKRMKTRDHILPRCYKQEVIPGVERIRPCCGRCNVIRGNINHCVGILILALQQHRANKKSLSLKQAVQMITMERIQLP